MMLERGTARRRPATCSTSHAVTAADIDPGDVVLGDHPPDGTKASPSRVFRPRTWCRAADTTYSTGRTSVALGVMAYVDVTDATFQTEVVERSKTVPVVVDLWAPWCGPCQTLGPIIEKVVDATDGKVAAGQGQRRREPGDQPGVPGAVRSRPCSPPRRPGRRRRSSAPTPSTRSQRFVEGLLPTEDESEIVRAARRRRRGQPAPGARARAGQRGRHRRPRRAARRARRRRGGAGAAGAHPGVRAHPQGRRRRPPRPGARRTTTTPRSTACCRG